MSATYTMLTIRREQREIHNVEKVRLRDLHIWFRGGDDEVECVIPVSTLLWVVREPNTAEEQDTDVVEVRSSYPFDDLAVTVAGVKDISVQRVGSYDLKWYVFRGREKALPAGFANAQAYSANRAGRGTEAA